MQQFSFPFCEEYSHSLEFKTSIVRRFDGSEQRQALWMCPKRLFNLNFETNNESKTALEDVFRLQKGDCDAFFWNWSAQYFGNNLDYTCFFDSHKLSQSIYHFSYAKTPLTLVTIEDFNILKGRYFLDATPWSFQGSVDFSSQKASYIGLSKLFQSDILIPGKSYKLKVKSQDIQGMPPYLSSDTAILQDFENLIFEGEKTLEFVALGADLIIEMPENSSGSFLEIALFSIPDNQAVFDFKPNVEHQSEILFSTLADEIFTFKNSRQNMVESPVRRWFLTFEFTPLEAQRFEAFFISKKGRFKPFEWFYNDENILVRFDTDKLDQKQYQLGYREIKVPIIEVLQ